VLFLGTQALAQGDTTYFDATNSIIDRTDPVGTQWHELYPDYCDAPYTITAWADDGDGILDSCDVIAMEDPQGQPECHHVIEVTYTLELTPVGGEPTDLHYWDWDPGKGGEPLTDPVCTWWTEIYPWTREEFHIVYWEDNGSGELDFCDIVFDNFDGQWHVEGVHTDMVTEPEDDCPVDPTTWSRVKSLYR
jgi:hypothetical protein